MSINNILLTHKILISSIHRVKLFARLCCSLCKYCLMLYTLILPNYSDKSVMTSAIKYNINKNDIHIIRYRDFFLT